MGNCVCSAYSQADDAHAEEPFNKHRIWPGSTSGATLRQGSREGVTLLLRPSLTPPSPSPSACASHTPHGGGGRRSSASQCSAPYTCGTHRLPSARRGSLPAPPCAPVPPFAQQFSVPSSPQLQGLPEPVLRPSGKAEAPAFPRDSALSVTTPQHSCPQSSLPAPSPVRSPPSTLTPHKRVPVTQSFLLCSSASGPPADICRRKAGSCAPDDPPCSSCMELQAAGCLQGDGGPLASKQSAGEVFPSFQAPPPAAQLPCLLSLAAATVGAPLEAATGPHSPFAHAWPADISKGQDAADRRNEQQQQQQQQQGPMCDSAGGVRDAPHTSAGSFHKELQSDWPKRAPSEVEGFCVKDWMSMHIAMAVAHELGEEVPPSSMLAAGMAADLQGSSSLDVGAKGMHALGSPLQGHDLKRIASTGSRADVRPSSLGMPRFSRSSSTNGPLPCGVAFEGGRLPDVARDGVQLAAEGMQRMLHRASSTGAPPPSLLGSSSSWRLSHTGSARTTPGSRNSNSLSTRPSHASTLQAPHIGSARTSSAGSSAAASLAAEAMTVLARTFSRRASKRRSTSDTGTALRAGKAAAAVQPPPPPGTFAVLDTTPWTKPPPHPARSSPQHRPSHQAPPPHTRSSPQHRPSHQAPLLPSPSSSPAKHAFSLPPPSPAPFPEADGGAGGSSHGRSPGEGGAKRLLGPPHSALCARSIISSSSTQCAGQAQAAHLGAHTASPPPAEQCRSGCTPAAAPTFAPTQGSSGSSVLPGGGGYLSPLAGLLPRCRSSPRHAPLPLNLQQQPWEEGTAARVRRLSIPAGPPQLAAPSSPPACLPQATSGSPTLWCSTSPAAAARDEHERIALQGFFSPRSLTRNGHSSACNLLLDKVPESLGGESLGTSTSSLQMMSDL